MKHFLYYILFIITLCLLGWLVPNLIENKVTDDELWWESYCIPDGSKVRIIHTNKCEAKRPLVVWNVQCDKINYFKEKIDVYDLCIHEEDIDMLNAISYRNIKVAMEEQWFFAEDETDYELCRLHEMMWDTTFRRHEAAFSIKNGELIPQNDEGNILLYYLAEHRD